MGIRKCPKRSIRVTLYWINHLPMKTLTKKQTPLSIKNITHVLLPLVFYVLIAGCGGDPPVSTSIFVPSVEPSINPTSTPTALIRSLEGKKQITLHISFNGSPQTGKAIITEKDGLIMLKIEVRPTVPVQPIFIGKGKCSNDVEYVKDLRPLIGGFSHQPVAGMTMKEFTSGEYVIVLEQRSPRSGELVACTDIPYLD